MLDKLVLTVIGRLAFLTRVWFIVIVSSQMVIPVATRGEKTTTACKGARVNFFTPMHSHMLVIIAILLKALVAIFKSNRILPLAYKYGFIHLQYFKVNLFLQHFYLFIL